MGFLYLKIKDLLKSVLHRVTVCEVLYVGRGSQSSLRPSLGSWLGGEVIQALVVLKPFLVAFCLLAKKWHQKPLWWSTGIAST